MKRILLCDNCAATDVRLAYTEATGLEVWRCSNCGDVKRWCPRCGQGWVRHMRLDPEEIEFYSCEECDATWMSVDQIAGIGENIDHFLSRVGRPWSYSEISVIHDKVL